MGTSFETGVFECLREMVNALNQLYHNQSVIAKTLNLSLLSPSEVAIQMDRLERVRESYIRAVYGQPGTPPQPSTPPAADGND